MKRRLTRTLEMVAVPFTFCLMLTACSSDLVAPANMEPSDELNFGPEQRLGDNEKDTSTPFLRYAPDGRLYAIWTEADDRPPHQAKQVRGSSARLKHDAKGLRRPCVSPCCRPPGDGGKSWSPPKQVNTTIEPVQGDENGPKVAFSPDKKAFVVWSIPGEKGDITRANIRFAMEDGKGGFTLPRTLNEIKDTARFPIIEFTPDKTLLVAWIDRRVDNPIPRSLF